MTSIVTDFKAIAKIVNRQEQKAEFEEKNPPAPDTSMYGWPYGVAVPLAEPAWVPVGPDMIYHYADDKIYTFKF